MKKNTIRLNKSTVFIAGTLHHLPANDGFNFGNVIALNSRKKANSEKDSLRVTTPKKSQELSKIPAKMPEIPFHPYSALAEIVAQKLESPINRRFLNGEIKRAPGSNGKKSILKNDGKLHGHAIRIISIHDREEIRGEISLALAEKPDGEKLTMENWKTIFSESRKTLRINRRLERENLLSSFEELQEINFHSDLTASAALLEFREREKSYIKSTDAFCDKIFAEELREYIRIILAACRDDKSRQRKANKKNALMFLKIWINNYRGFGHGQTNTKKHHGGIHLHKLNEAGKVFVKYIASGKCRLELEKAAYQKAVIEYNDNLAMFAIGE
jgi:hypothetical protein